MYIIKFYTILLLFLGLLPAGCGDDTSAQIPGGKLVASVRCVTSMCFGRREYELSIVSLGKVSYALLDSAGKLKKKIELDPTRKLAFRQFIKELKGRRHGGSCTNQDEYEVKVGDEVIKKVDAGCGWNGFDKLQVALFGDRN